MSNMPPFLQFSANETESEDYVKWQSSQTACVALNQLIKTSSNDSSLPENAGASRGWQREPSFDQIPGFSLLSTNDAFASSSSLTEATTTPSSAPRSRPRPSITRHRSPAVPHDQTNVSTPIPSGTKLLDIMKGVSACLDENVQVRSRSGRGRGSLLGPMRTKDKKKARSGIPDLQAGRPKKSTVDALRQAESDGRISTDKGKGRAVPSSGEPALLLDGPLLESRRSRIMDVDSGEKSSSTVQTSSQDQMPPPPAPLSRYPPLEKPVSTAVKTSGLVVPDQPPIPRPTPQHKHPYPTRTKPQGPERVPQLHPLLLKPSSSSSSSSLSSSKPQPPPKSTTPEASTPLRHAQAPLKAQTTLPKETKPTIRPIYPPSKPLEASQSSVPSSTPNPASSQSSRPPALGMRRTHTFPAPGMSTSLQKNGVLPTRQKAFKSPLLPGSQPQSQPQVQRQQHKYDSPRNPAASNGSSSSDSPSGSSSSFTSASTGASTPSRTSVSPSGSSHKQLAKTDVRSPLARSASTSAAIPSSLPMDIPVEAGSLPEPSDGDGDSSFGDMSFDMDALEETMKLYD